MDDRLAIFRGAPTLADVADLHGPTSDDAYEADLKRCRSESHRLFSFFVDGFEVLVCSRCHTRWGETP